MELTGKNILVTGGASGLGAATVAALQTVGARPVVLDLQPTGAAPSAIGSVTNEADVMAAIALAGELHGVVHCAGLATAQRTVGKDGPLALEAFAKPVMHKFAHSNRTHVMLLNS